MNRMQCIALPFLALALTLPACSGGEENNTTDPDPGTETTKQPPAKSISDAEFNARNNEGVGLMGQFRYVDALVIFEELAEVRPDNHDIAVNRAIATLNRQLDGDEARALELLEEVLNAEPDHARANYCAGLLKMYQGPPAEPFPHFKKVADLGEPEAFTAYLVGKCYENEGDFATALEWYNTTAALDPYLNSANHRMASVLYRLDRVDEGDAASDQFQRLKENPRARNFEFAYMKMGPLGEALTIDPPALEAPTMPDGALFAEATTFAAALDQPVQSWTTCDVDLDGDLDLLAIVADDPSLPGQTLFFANNDSVFAADPNHALSGIDGVLAALWGDLDNDGRTDLFLCRDGKNAYLHNSSAGTFDDRTDAAQFAGMSSTVGGFLADADHDGDLDVFCANADEPSVLWSNNLDGTFRMLGDAQGIATTGNARAVLASDMDSDRDLDILQINSQPPHLMFENDRLWEWRSPDVRPGFLDAEITVAASADLNADGWPELVAGHAAGITIWWRDAANRWNDDTEIACGAVESLDVRDVDGDGMLDIVASSAEGSVFRIPADNLEQRHEITSGVRTWILANVQPTQGPSLIAASDMTAMAMHPGPARFSFAPVRFSGAVDDGQSMRSNASGIGASWAARVGTQWITGEFAISGSGSGQSLEPVAIGTVGQDNVDFLEIDWSDGVFQSELALDSQSVNDVTETQRQLSSCPLLFAWNGTEFTFISDLLGVGGVGFLVEPGVYAPPRPWESFRIPSHQLKPKDGTFIIKLHEAMEEACYLDHAALTAYDLPPGTDLTVDDRLAVLGPAPTGRPVVFRDAMRPTRATNDRGEDVTSELRLLDEIAPDVGPLDRRFIGRLAEPHVLTVEFDQPLDARDGVVPTLIVDGWIEYPYSQTVFAAWQANAAISLLKLEARDTAGAWHTIIAELGGPGGMPRQWSMPMAGLPTGATAIRLSGTAEVYCDRLRVAWEDVDAAPVRTALPMQQARLERTGFPERTTGPQHRPWYDYSNRAPYWDTRYLEGDYTRMGPVDGLVAERDDVPVIFGPGEEVDLRFDAAGLPPLADGWTRVFVLETSGWCKDMDLFTLDGETVGPVPYEGWDESTSQDERDAELRSTLTRFRSGR